MTELERLLEQVKVLRAEGKILWGLTDAERESWVYGQCKLSNPAITRELVRKVIEESK